MFDLSLIAAETRTRFVSSNSRSIALGCLGVAAVIAASGCTHTCTDSQGRSNSTQSTNVASQSTTQKAPGDTPVPTYRVAAGVEMNGSNIMHARRGFDPLWIESASSAERSRPPSDWSPYNTNVELSSTSMTNVDEVAVAQDAAEPDAQTPIDDGPEGLQHITTASQGADFDPQISRDGRLMVFASTQHRPTSDIYIKQVNGRTVTQLTAHPAQDVMPVLSPDAKRIAFASNRRGNWDIHVMSSKGGQAVQITTDSSHELHPSWSPDGKKLVFCRLGQISGRWELWVVDADGSGSNEFVGYGLFPSWCPVAGTGEGGRDKILYQRSRERGDRAFSLWTIDYKPGDASSPTEIASDSDAALINGSWSPDGKHIVYASVQNPNADAFDTLGGRTSAESELWLLNIDGSGRVALTPGRHLNLQPTWASDGRVYFVSDRSGINNIWSLGTEQALAAAENPASMESEQAHATDGSPTSMNSPMDENLEAEDQAAVNAEN